MKTQEVPTYTATIWCGLREDYKGRLHTIQDAMAICQCYVDEVGLCVSLTPTWFHYTKGNEPGCTIGLLHYPRFPLDQPAEVLEAHARALAERLLLGLGQNRVSIVLPDRTIMLERNT